MNILQRGLKKEEIAEESILETIEAGANAITYTPPTNSQLFKHKMQEYREIENKKYNKEF